MDKNYLKKVIKNYRRNKKRIREIERDYYGISGIDYSTVGNNKKSGTYDEIPAKVEAFDTNKERIKLQKEIDAVDRMLLRLDSKEQIIYEYYFIQNLSWDGIVNRGYSRGAISNSLEVIYLTLKEEIML